ncbi:hypothetical protein Tco_1030491 [Tanacetum coccineum]|uniref:Uncharacterized protein n=1 Tax=Tanacetum coccineum TaxID=301880 RepID=A0ABQ5G7T8_9ASTR
MSTFMKWYCHRVNKTEHTQADFEGQGYEVVKAFYPDVIHLQSQLEECHKMLTDHVDWTNPEEDQVRFDVNRPLPLGGPPGHVTIQTNFFFNKDLEYLRYGNKGSMLVLSISKMKASRYPDFGLELLVPEHIHDALSRRKEVRSNMRILSGHLDHLPGSDKRMLSTAIKLWTRNLVIRQRFKHDYTIIESLRPVVFPVNNKERKIMLFNEIYKFSDGTLSRILEALDFRVKEYKIKRLNPRMNTRFWTQKDVTRSK